MPTRICDGCNNYFPEEDIYDFSNGSFCMECLLDEVGTETNHQENDYVDIIDGNEDVCDACHVFFNPAVRYELFPVNDGELKYCALCLTENTIKCVYCNNYFTRDRMTPIESGHYICNSCANDRRTIGLEHENSVRQEPVGLDALFDRNDRNTRRRVGFRARILNNDLVTIFKHVNEIKNILEDANGEL